MKSRKLALKRVQIYLFIVLNQQLQYLLFLLYRSEVDVQFFRNQTINLNESDRFLRSLFIGPISTTKTIHVKLMASHYLVTFIYQSNATERKSWLSYRRFISIHRAKEKEREKERERERVHPEQKAKTISQVEGLQEG